MNIWNELDRGAVKEDEAFEQADQAVRKRNAARTRRSESRIETHRKTPTEQR